MKRILVGLAMTPHTASEVREAVNLARVHEASLTGVMVVDLERIGHTGAVPLGAGQSAAQLAKYLVDQAQMRTEQAIALFESACKDCGVTYKVVKETGDPFEMLVSLWRYHDLTILGMDSLVYEGLIDEPEDALIRLIGKGVRPVLTVSREFSPPRRVLVGYHGSMESAKALKRFVQTRLWPDLELRIVCFQDGARGDPGQLLEDAADYCRHHGYPVEAFARPGGAQAGLLQEAQEWDAQIIVAGNSLRRLLVRKVFGDTVMRLIKESDRALFLTQ